MTDSINFESVFLYKKIYNLFEKSFADSKRNCIFDTCLTHKKLRMMKNLTTYIAERKIEIYHASAITAGYGHKKITVELFYNGEYQKFTATTDNMPGFDAAMEFEGAEKYHALYELIEYSIIDAVAEWLENINE